MRKEIPSESLDLKAISLIMLLSLFWGGNSPAMKIALRDMQPFILAGLRFTLAAAAVWGWAIYRGISLSLRPSELPPLIILALCFAAQISTFNLGTHLSLASRASLLINTHPFFVALMAHFFIPSDRLNFRKVMGLLVAFSGVALIFRDSIVSGGRSHLLGDLTLVLSAFILGVQTVYTKRVVQDMPPVKLLAWQMSFALIPFYLMSFLFEDPTRWKVSESVVGMLIYQGILVGFFCFITWTTLLRRYSASKIAAFLFATPIFGVALSWLILGDKLTIWLGAGTALVAAGIYIVNSIEG
ncbi:TPA: DMT family transporter [Candidatus Poribacteria bacterium]|nr:DMT family transporter [Candidatus Poribacteria bacterium]HEX29509.1 DMT family transporter [Candidatus Poribacteria bacterium]